ncbi:MAG: hypothetical protein IAF38_12405 [Bacteroidia bacterium]|nr:hypothetical protein [Bacteroidia bacterium]
MEKIILKKRWRLRKKNLIIKIMSWFESGYRKYSYEGYEKIQTRRETEVLNIFKKINLN